MMQVMPSITIMVCFMLNLVREVSAGNYLCIYLTAKKLEVI